MPDDYFQINTTELLQLLGDPKFYEENTAFLFMKDGAMAAVAKYNAAILTKKKSCQGCNSSVDEEAIVTGIMGSFVRMLIMLAGLPTPTDVDKLRQYVISKLGYTPACIRLYYAANKDGDRKFVEF